jgi:hypothetical protein
VSDETKSCCTTEAESCSTQKPCCKARCCVLALVILATLLIVGVLINAMIKYTTPAPLNADRAAFRAKNLVELRAANTEALTTYGYVDAQRGIVRLPIEQAMKITVEEWKNPAVGRKLLLDRQAKASAALPKAPEKPSAFE